MALRVYVTEPNDIIYITEQCDGKHNSSIHLFLTQNYHENT